MPPALALALIHLEGSRFFARRSCLIMYGLDKLDAAPNVRSRMSVLLLTRERLDWTGRRPPAACSVKGRYVCQSLLEIDPHIMTTALAHVRHVRARCELPTNPWQPS